MMIEIMTLTCFIISLFMMSPSSTFVTGLTSSWVQYIDALRKATELEKLRVARESMNAVFPLTPKMWLEWCEDESRLATGYNISFYEPTLNAIPQFMHLLIIDDKLWTSIL